ncbi:MAG: ABC transporter permease [Candidatus Rokubacteria bacterium]|nr:ABC transporter permease [Candidatus Rokubacteria bacterium]
MSSLLPFLIGEAFRDLKRAGRVAVSAVLLITLSLAALGAFWVLSLNLGRAVAQWRDRLRVVVYLREEPPTGAVEGLLRKVEAVGGIQRLRYVSKAEALQTLRRQLGGQASVLEQLSANPLPSSVEVTPVSDASTPEGTRALIQRLSALVEVEEVQGGTEWVERLAQWQRLLQGIGLGVGAVLALAAILTVTTATTLVLHVRREEMEIMRLVGASEMVIRVPLFLQGLAQGLLGAAVAVGGLYLAYMLALPTVEPLLSLTLGLPRATFFSPTEMALLLSGGGLLGACGGLLAKGRSESGRQS